VCQDEAYQVGPPAEPLPKTEITEVLCAQGTNESSDEMHTSKPEYTISSEKLAELDALYAERSASGRPTGWGALVEALREIRRTVEAGVIVKVDGAPDLRSWQGFYSWAHGRYHMLEDGYDRWIGDDAS